MPPSVPSLSSANPNSAITRLPVGLRTDALNKLSANANAPGGAKQQLVGGRAQQRAAKGLRYALGIYLIETRQTGASAYSVGGATPATISCELGTPPTPAVVDSAPPAPAPLIPVTFSGAPGPRSLTVQVATELAGNAKVPVA